MKPQLVLAACITCACSFPAQDFSEKVNAAVRSSKPTSEATEVRAAAPKVEIEIIKIRAPGPIVPTLHATFQQEKNPMDLPADLPSPHDLTIPLAEIIEAHLEAETLPEESRDERDANPLSPLQMSPLYKSYDRYRSKFEDDESQRRSGRQQREVSKSTRFGFRG
ncbi:unnamed protein product [Cyprideis torosa]|uniref:Uncharacterized protein n=1 Tax=Cyprideis torosa TaxID=163714 RepID=A0A7R8ZLI3_9CRUS|nr:unnamed protein product [Cyprideis torosa]CAG0886775.1 unnamed protein product [Cyprideis torosa]